MKDTIDIKELSLGNVYDIKNALEFWLPTLPEGKQALAKRTLDKIEKSLNTFLEESSIDEKHIDDELKELMGKK